MFTYKRRGKTQYYEVFYSEKAFAVIQRDHDGKWSGHLVDTKHVKVDVHGYRTRDQAAKVLWRHSGID